MADPKIYAHTYWANKGKYPEVKDALEKMIPDEGEVPNAKDNPFLEKFRIASNCYYDLYNNGLCNRSEEFEDVFRFVGPYQEWDSEDDDDLSPVVDVNKAWWTRENIDRVEAKIDEFILRAAEEQGIECPEVSKTSVQDEVDRISAELASNHAKLTAVLEKPKVQLTGKDSNVFSIIGRVTSALKKAGQADKAKEFTDKAFAAGSYDEVLRLAMTYCDVS